VASEADEGFVMISRLKGEVVEIDGDSVVIDVQGVGYEVACTSALLSRISIGAAAVVSVYTDVRENAIRLFGFDSVAERHIFLLLNRVSGMGPRSSLDVVSNVAIRDLLRAIGSGDVKALMSIRGVGKKKAERIVVELKDLVATMAGERADSLRSALTVERGPVDQVGGLSADAISALEVLGFGRRDAEVAVNQALASQVQFPAVGDLVREALRFV
jgi:Holliday junction DNA helicase RuvA